MHCFPMELPLLLDVSEAPGQCSEWLGGTVISSMRRVIGGHMEKRQNP